MNDPAARPKHTRRRRDDGLFRGQEVLPPPDVIDPAPLRRRVRRYFLLSLLLLAFWLAVGAGAVLLAVLRQHDAQWLLTHGTRTTAYVSSSENPKRGMPSYVVEYDGHTATIHGFERHYTGELVDVYYNPDDPSRVRTAETANYSAAAIFSVVFPGIAAVVGMLTQTVIVARWPRWLRSVDREGWRHARLDVLGVPHRSERYLKVSFANGALLKAPVPRASFRRLVDGIEQPVLAGGDPSALVLLFQNGTLRRLKARVASGSRPNT